MSRQQSKIYLFDPLTQEKKETTYEYLSGLTGRKIGDLRSLKTRKGRMRKFGWYIVDDAITNDEYRDYINIEIPGEVWKKFRNSNVEVSSHGRARSIKNLRLKKLTFNCGVVRTSVRINGRYKCFVLHRMIAEAFGLSGEIKDELYVYHIDGNPYNSRLDNLKIADKEEFFKRGCISKRSKVVFKLDPVTGEKLDEFLSISDAASECFADKSSIARGVLSMRETCGFCWATNETLDEVRGKIKEGKTTSLVRLPKFLVRKVDINTDKVVNEYRGYRDIANEYKVTRNAVGRWIKDKKVVEGKYIFIREVYVHGN